MDGFSVTVLNHSDKYKEEAKKNETIAKSNVKRDKIANGRLSLPTQREEKRFTQRQTHTDK